MAHAKTAAKIGIIADNLLQQHLLKTALMHFGFNVVLTADPNRMLEGLRLCPELDAWIVDIVDDEGDQLSWLDELFDGEVPVLFGMGEAPQRSSESYPRWEKRLFAKMKELLADHSLTIADETAISDLAVSYTHLTLPTIYSV